MALFLTVLPFFMCGWLLLMLMPVRINLFLLRENKNDFVTIRVNTFFSLIRFQVEIPLIAQETPLDVTVEAELKAGEDTLVAESKKKGSLWQLDPERVRELAGLAYLFRHRLKFMAKFLIKAVTVERFELRAKGGVSDAALTGCISGLIWTTAGTILVPAQQAIRLKSQPILSFTPDFSPQPSFFLRLDTTVSYRLGHFVMTGAAMLVTIIRGGKKFWKTILSRD